VVASGESHALSGPVDRASSLRGELGEAKG